MAQLISQEDGKNEGDNESSKKRCEIVLNSLLAEIDHIHDERRIDLQETATILLNTQIAFYQRILDKLISARSQFQPEALKDLAEQGPRLPSLLEKHVLVAPKARDPLPEPSSFGLPAAASAGAFPPFSGVVASMYPGPASVPSILRSAFSAIRAQLPASEGPHGDTLMAPLDSPGFATSSRFVQFLDWSMNSRGEQRRHA